VLLKLGLVLRAAATPIRVSLPPGKPRLVRRHNNNPREYQNRCLIVITTGGMLPVGKRQHVGQEQRAEHHGKGGKRNQTTLRHTAILHQRAAASDD
jgi:hypothetical protein